MATRKSKKDRLSIHCNSNFKFIVNALLTRYRKHNSGSGSSNDMNNTMVSGIPIPPYEGKGHEPTLDFELCAKAQPQDRAFRVLIGTILSQRTRDENTDRACNALFSVYGTVQELCKAEVSDIEKLIKPVGFYRVKSRRIKEVAKLIEEKYGGVVPQDLDELMMLPAVGRKTANCVLVFGYGIPALPVDTHVHRISNRLGWVNTKTAEETERALRKLLPKRYWIDINELLVKFGQDICRPIRPKCSLCMIKSACSYYKNKG